MEVLVWPNAQEHGLSVKDGVPVTVTVPRRLLPSVGQMVSNLMIFYMIHLNFWNFFFST